MAAIFDGAEVLNARDKANRMVPYDAEIKVTTRRVLTPEDRLPGAKSVFVIGLRLPQGTVARNTQPPAEAVGPYAFAQYQSISLLRVMAFRAVRLFEDRGFHAMTTLDLCGTASFVGNPRGPQPDAFANRFAAVAAGLLVRAAARGVQRLMDVPDQMQQVFLNLLINSVEAMSEGGTLRATTITYSYDQLNRLTNETSVSDEAERNFAAGYSYDLVGNRLAKSTTRNQDGLPETTTYAYNAGDQLASEASSIQANGTTAYTWDVNGSMTGKANVATGESATYTYNLENRLSAAGIQRRDKDHQGTYHNVAIGATYDYDVSGIRCRSDSSTTIQGSGTTSTARTFLIDHNNR